MGEKLFSVTLWLIGSSSFAILLKDICLISTLLFFLKKLITCSEVLDPAFTYGEYPDGTWASLLTTNISLLRRSVGISKNNLLIRVEQQSGGDQIQQNVVEIVKTSLNSYLSSEVNFRRTEVVGPKVSGELIQSGAIAILAAVFAMLIYIWFRFEWQFSLGAVVALIHDVILTIGVFSITPVSYTHLTLPTTPYV